LRTFLQELQTTDSSLILVVRCISQLGFRSRGLLRRHFSRYGEVARVMVAHSKARSLHEVASSRIRPGNLGLVVMIRREDVDMIFALGTEHTVEGVRVKVCKFDRRTMNQEGNLPCGSRDSTAEDYSVDSQGSDSGSTRFSLGSMQRASTSSQDFDGGGSAGPSSSQWLPQISGSSSGWPPQVSGGSTTDLPSPPWLPQVSGSSSDWLPQVSGGAAGQPPALPPPRFVEHSVAILAQCAEQARKVQQSLAVFQEKCQMNIASLSAPFLAQHQPWMLPELTPAELAACPPMPLGSPPGMGLPMDPNMLSMWYSAQGGAGLQPPPPSASRIAQLAASLAASGPAVAMPQAWMEGSAVPARATAAPSDALVAALWPAPGSGPSPGRGAPMSAAAFAAAAKGAAPKKAKLPRPTAAGSPSSVSPSVAAVAAAVSVSTAGPESPSSTGASGPEGVGGEPVPDVEAGSLEQRSGDDSFGTLRSHLIQVKNMDEASILVVRGVHRLGFSSAEILRGHFEHYGRILKVLVAHTQQASGSKRTPQNKGALEKSRMRPGCLGIVVFGSAEIAQRVLTIGEHQFVGGIEVHVHRLQRAERAARDATTGSENGSKHDASGSGSGGSSNGRSGSGGAAAGTSGTGGGSRYSGREGDIGSSGSEESGSGRTCNSGPGSSPGTDKNNCCVEPE